MKYTEGGCRRGNVIWFFYVKKIVLVVVVVQSGYDIKIKHDFFFKLKTFLQILYIQSTKYKIAPTPNK